jgi:hypothetical protein
MYIILIALLYVLMMMVVTSESIFKGVMILLLGSGLIALVFYLLDTPRRIRSRRMADEADRPDTNADE